MTHYIVNSPGCIITKFDNTNHRVYLDKLCIIEERWIRARQFSKYLRYTYNLSPFEYCNIVMFNNATPVHYCKQCGKQFNARFLGLSRQYTKYCSEECYHIMLSAKAINQHKDCDSTLNIGIRKSFENSERRQRQSDIMRKINEQMWSNDEYREYMTAKAKSKEHGRNSFYAQAKAKRGYFLSIVDDSKLCHFYLAITNSNTLKFGITSTSIYDRLYRCNHKTIHTILSSNKYVIADLECNLKIDLHIYSEYVSLSKLHDIILYLKSYIANLRSSQTIETHNLNCE